MMHGPVSHYILLARRWAWVVMLGIVICGGISYVISKLSSPIYQASAIFVINVDSTSSANTSSSIDAVPTYAQLLTNPLILNPVVVKHRGITLEQLNAMISVKTQTNTQLIGLDVQNGDPRLAAQLANEVGQSFLLYSNSQLPGSVQMLPATVPTVPVKPRPLQNAGIGALIGLGLAITLIVVFEWMGDHLSSSEEAQELLAMDVLAVIPRFSENGRKSGGSVALKEQYRILAARLNSAQSLKPFKLVLVTSAQAGEGKSTLAANLATSLATADKRVLLIDANLRHPMLDQHFQLENQRGLSSVFLEMWSSPRSELYGQQTSIPTLRVLTSGVLPTRPAELLQSPLAYSLFEHLKEAPFDFVIFDSPPLLPVADAEIMSALVQAVIFVVDASETPRRVLARAKRVLARTHSRGLGIALNKSPWLASQGYPDKRQQGPENSSLASKTPRRVLARAKRVLARARSRGLGIASKTPRRVLARAKRVLARTHSRGPGIALNKSPWLADQGYPDKRQQGPENSSLASKTPSELHTPAPYINTGAFPPDASADMTKYRGEARPASSQLGKQRLRSARTDPAATEADESSRESR